jgi:anti-anti-sigma regulatory factor
MLKITKSTNGEVVLKLSGRMTSENVPELQALVSSEATSRNIILDLKDLTIVDRDAVSFLQGREADGVELKNCPIYIREWIRRERG